VNELTGYIVGEDHNNWGGVILKTTDGGNNWMNLTSDSLFPVLIFALSFLNANTGFVSGYSNNIYKTTNGGLNWSYTIAPTFGNSRYKAIQFLDENTGYIGGRYGMGAKTTNGGITWDTLNFAYRQIYSIFFFDAYTGFMGDSFSAIYKTTNGGTNWSTTFLRDTSSSASTYMITHIDFLNEMTGYVAGATSSNSKGAIFKTTNQGNNWINIFYQDNLELYGIDLVNDTTIVAAGYEGKILKTSNGGNTWSITQVPNVNWTLYSIQFINENTGFTSGYGHVFKTTNGGTFINTLSNELPKQFELYQNYPNPFNPKTKIRFEITTLLNPPFNKLGNGGLVKLIIYDVLGREVATLVNERLKAGTYEVEFDAYHGGSLTLPSGVYFYTLITMPEGRQVESFKETKKMILMK
jgi:photosystem II stability/assembly factor-like uncharacterized protein